MMAEGPMNYTSSVPVMKSITEIQEILASHGADEITIRYADRQPVALEFTAQTPYGARVFRLPANVDAVYTLLQRAVERNKRIATAHRGRDQAARTAWRVIRDWCLAQMALIEAGMVSLDQIMLPYMLEGSSDRTMYEALVAHELRLLPERTGV